MNLYTYLNARGMPTVASVGCNMLRPSLSRLVCEARERDDFVMYYAATFKNLFLSSRFVFFYFSKIKKTLLNRVDGIANDLGTVGSVSATAEHSRVVESVVGYINGDRRDCAVRNITLHSRRSMNPIDFARMNCRLVDKYIRLICTQNCMRWMFVTCVHGDVNGVCGTPICTHAFFPLHLYSIWFTLRDKNYRSFRWFEHSNDSNSHFVWWKERKTVDLISICMFFVVVVNIIKLVLFLTRSDSCVWI